jgi:phosphoserine phosphatase
VYAWGVSEPIRYAQGKLPAQFSARGGRAQTAFQEKAQEIERRRTNPMVKQYLLASDFDQTLSFNDSGVALSELIGFHGFHDKVKGLSEMNLVQQGAELSYLILHDPDFRRVRKEHLVQTGKRIRLKHDVDLFARSLENISDGYKISFYVISAAPQEIIQSALEGIVPPEHIFGTRFRYNEATGEVESIVRASAGWGKITVLEELRANLGISHDHIIYMGDGSSDLPVMMHVNQYDGLTIAVSEAKFISRIARRTVLSDNAMSVLVPVLEEVLHWDSPEIRRFFAARGLMLREWDKMRTDMLTIEENSAPNTTAAVQ